MYLTQVFQTHPLSAISLCLCLITIFWSIRLLRTRRRGPDRFLLGLIGLVCVYQGLDLLDAVGLWKSSADPWLNELASLCVDLLYLLAVFVVARLGDEHRSAQVQLRVMEATTPRLDADQPAEHSLEHLLGVLNALPLAISTTDRHGKVLFQNAAARQRDGETAAAAGWSAPIAHQGGELGIVVQIQPAGRTGELVTALRKWAHAAVEEREPATLLGDRRRQFRLPVGQRVQVETLDGSALHTQGETLDFSGHGIGLLLAAPLTFGTVALVRLGESLVMGRVKNCQKTAAGFRVGLEIDQFLSSSTPPTNIAETDLNRREATRASHGAWPPVDKGDLVGVVR